jgi:putative transposase
MPYREAPFCTGEYYHLYNRGVNFQPVFFEQANHQHFLWLIRQHLLRGLKLIAYCLMPNHYHLLVQLTDDDLSHSMQAFALAYTKAVNKRYNRVGPLFQGRFQAIHVDRDEYLLHLSRYIHLNPVAAHLVRHPEVWDFSSCADYFGLRQSLPLFPEIVLAQFPSRTAYRSFVDNYVDQDIEVIRHLLPDEE